MLDHSTRVWVGGGWQPPEHPFWCLLPGLRLRQGLGWLALLTMATSTELPEPVTLALGSQRGKVITHPSCGEKRVFSGWLMSVESVWCSPSGFGFGGGVVSAVFWMDKSEHAVGKTGQGGGLEGSLLPG